MLSVEMRVLMILFPFRALDYWKESDKFKHINAILLHFLHDCCPYFLCIYKYVWNIQRISSTLQVLTHDGGKIIFDCFKTIRQHVKKNISVKSRYT